MTKKSIVSLLIVLVLLVMILDFNINGAHVLESYYEQMETESMDKLSKIQQMDFDSEWESKISESVIDAEDIDRLKINNIGSMNISGEKRNDVEIKAVIKVYADTKQRAREFLSELNIKSNKSDKKLTLLLNKIEKPAYINGIRVEYEIKAPENMALDLNNKFGEMEVSHFIADVNLSNKYKMMRVNDIDGDARVNAKYGNLYLENIKGYTNIYNRYNETVIKNLGDDLVLDAKYSKTKIRSITGSAKIKTSYGEMDIYDIEGDIQLNSRYTVIGIMKSAGKINADLDYGDLKVYEILNDINVDSKYTDINLKLTPEINNYLIDCKTEYGDIETNLELPFTKDDNKEMIKGETGSGTDKVEIDVEGRYSDIVINR